MEHIINISYLDLPSGFIQPCHFNTEVAREVCKVWSETVKELTLIVDYETIGSWFRLPQNGPDFNIIISIVVIIIIIIIIFIFILKLNLYTSIGHPWICENGVAPDRALDPAVLSRLKQFSAMNKLKKMALRVRIKS